MVVVKNLLASAGDLKEMRVRSLVKSCKGGNGSSLQYSCLKNPMDRGAWWTTVHRVTKNWLQLKRFGTHVYLVQRMDNFLFEILCL